MSCRDADIALFAIAAGNGGQDMNARKGDSAGVARLSANYGNVISVGAVQRVGMTTYGGLLNANNVQRASYSNYGLALTLTAPVDAPAMNKYGATIFDGTSCANPHVAGVASLVWSVNAGLRGDEVRQILIDTAMDVGAAGRDKNFGYGLINADAAVRRAVALARDKELALLVPVGDSSPQLAGYSRSSPPAGRAPLPPSTVSYHEPAAQFAVLPTVLSQEAVPATGGLGLATVSAAAIDAAFAETTPEPTPLCAIQREPLAAGRAVQPALSDALSEAGLHRRQEAALLDDVFASAFDATLETGLLLA